MPRELPDLTHRIDPALLPERMDEPCAYETFLAIVGDLSRLNRLLRAYPPAVAFLQEALTRSTTGPTPGKPWNIVDVGSGGGDTLRHIARWALKRRLRLQLTGIDLNPHATRAAAELSAGDRLFASIRWLTGDVFTRPETRNPDLVLSALVTHHMRDDEIVAFLRWMELHGRGGWFISDLLRSPRSYRLYGPLSRAMRLHPDVRHDGLVSIRRAFREEDWTRLLSAAGIPGDAVQMRRSSIGRLCLSRLR